MRTKRPWTMNSLIVMGCVLVALATQGCPCPKCPETVATGFGTPVPGPIIDTTVDGGGKLTYRYDEAAVSGSSGDTINLDNRFFKKILAGMLIDSDGATNGNKQIFGLAKDVAVKFTFNDGESYTVKMGNAATPLVWTCSKVGGSTNVTLVAGNSGEIPNCMATSLTRTVTSIEASTGEKGDILAIVTSK